MSKCEFCEKYDFSKARTKVDEWGAVIETALCNTQFSKEEQFNFCPVCGRDLSNENEFKFDYGVVTYKHRFSLNRSLDDYEEITLNKCIRMGVQYKYKTVACDKLIAEMQIIYKDENDKLHCLCEDLHDFTFSIEHKGNMQINL